MSTLLGVYDLSCGYTNVPVLRQVNVEIRQDEVVGLLGANGAGKTTLLRAVAGALRVSSGAIELDGDDITRAQPWTRTRQGLAHVPEGRHIFATMTVLDNLRVAARAVRRSARPPRTMEEIFSLFPILAERRDQAGGTLSGGEQQMLAIARALMSRPKVLLADELSAGLSPLITEQVFASLREIRAQGVGMLIVEQSAHYIANLVDRVYLMEQGRIVAEGTLDGLGGASRLAELYLGVR